ncbi:MAG: polysaccharide deacetylase family protein [Xanthobacteraceae bacterium]|nr:polysaccharide deacetylase family protein [Xanthobacteraceae bacterium]
MFPIPKAVSFALPGHRAAALGIWLGLLASTGLAAHAATGCPGNPNALGTSRTLVVDPTEHPLIGTMQYRQTLPLKDHEVVLTFDDGPLPANSNRVLQTLASECVKATFFIIGRMARQFPEGVRKLRAAGHSIGTHSENHPLHFNKMSPERIRQEIDDGIRHTAEALGDPSAVAPFFRVPGLRRGEVMEDYLASKGIQSWSADFPADDWLHITPDQVYSRAIARIEAKGRGILLLHDIQPRTVAALPRILQTLKERGYRIVHVVPAAPGRPATPTEPREWYIHPPAASVAMAHWPRVPKFLFVSTATLPGPALSDSDLYGGRLRDLDLPAAIRRADDGHAAATGPLQSTAPFHAALNTANNLLALPVPSQSIFARPERAAAASHGLSPAVRLASPHGPVPAATPLSRAPRAAEAGGEPRHTFGTRPTALPDVIPSTILQR